MRSVCSASRGPLPVRESATGVLLSRPQTPLLSLRPVLFPCRDELLQRHTSMSVYNFCRRRSACPAGTQCQSDAAVNVIRISSISRHAMLSEETAQPSNKNDIKQKSNRVCPRLVAVRLLFIRLSDRVGKCLTCMPPIDAVPNKEKVPVWPMVYACKHATKETLAGRQNGKKVSKRNVGENTLANIDDNAVPCWFV